MTLDDDLGRLWKKTILAFSKGIPHIKLDCDLV
jgi:hypothetical protein